MLTPETLKYAKTHEWLQGCGNTVKVGISDFAQSSLGDLVFVNLPEVGAMVAAGEVFADVESVKAVSDLFSPVTGEVVAVNEELLNAPELVNSSPYDSWLIEVGSVTDSSDLMDAADYAEFCANEEH